MKKNLKNQNSNYIINQLYIILLLLSTSLAFSQNTNPELDSLVSKALENNKGIKAAQLQVDKMKENIKTAYSFDKTNIYYSYDQNNLAFNNEPLKVFGVQQRFAFPTVYGAQKKVYTSEYEKEKANFDIQKIKLSLEVSKVVSAYCLFAKSRKTVSCIWIVCTKIFLKQADRKFELGETNYLEKITAQSKFRQIRSKLSQIESDKKAQYEILYSLIQTDEKIMIKK